MQLFCRRLFPGLRKSSERVLYQLPADADIGDGSRHHPIEFKQRVHGVSSGGKIVIGEDAVLGRFDDGADKPKEICRGILHGTPNLEKSSHGTMIGIAKLTPA